MPVGQSSAESHGCPLCGGDGVVMGWVQRPGRGGPRPFTVRRCDACDLFYECGDQGAFREYLAWAYGGATRRISTFAERTPFYDHLADVLKRWIPPGGRVLATPAACSFSGVTSRRRPGVH